MLPVNQQDPKTPKRATLDVKRQIFMAFILAEHKIDRIRLNKDSFASETFLVDGKSMVRWMALCPMVDAGAGRGLTGLP